MYGMNRVTEMIDQAAAVLKIPLSVSNSMIFEAFANASRRSMHGVSTVCTLKASRHFSASPPPSPEHSVRLPSTLEFVLFKIEDDFEEAIDHT